MLPRNWANFPHFDPATTPGTPERSHGGGSNAVGLLTLLSAADRQRVTSPAHSPRSSGQAHSPPLASHLSPAYSDLPPHVGSLRWGRSSPNLPVEGASGVTSRSYPAEPKPPPSASTKTSLQKSQSSDLLIDTRRSSGEKKGCKLKKTLSEGKRKDVNDIMSPRRPRAKSRGQERGKEREKERGKEKEK
eukprot:CAMPEP_0177666316 /NCGR_PEP_ID=MMETSP0447-20121125/21516_1 /TAXON_ID=0 /ORGANISM="Stygamoeba regulata, Strain BSH-02190019" /LENGTH=188 /DNA_ID=CAMNT_0019172455 /DNA_START=212 /DNA_END=775 /DNA_ORIENTATION=+